MENVWSDFSRRCSHGHLESDHLHAAHPGNPSYSNELYCNDLMAYLSKS